MGGVVVGGAGVTRERRGAEEGGERGRREETMNKSICTPPCGVRRNSRDADGVERNLGSRREPKKQQRSPLRSLF